MPRRLDPQPVNRLAEQSEKIAAVECEEDVGAGECGEQHGLVLGRLEDDRPVEDEFVALEGGVHAQREPGAGGLGWFAREVVAGLMTRDPVWVPVSPATEADRFAANELVSSVLLRLECV